MRMSGRYSIGKTSYARSATSDRVETRSLCSMVFIWSPDTPEIHPKFHGGISKNLRILFIPSSVIPRSRLLDTRRWLDVLLTPKHVSAIRHVEAIKYSAVFLAELPNGLQIAGLTSGTAGRPSGRSAINCVLRIRRLYVSPAQHPRTGRNVCDCELPLSRMRRRHRARNKSARMLEMWQALATGLGTNTSSHSEQGKAIAADKIIDKR